ncbi:MAG: ABC transporter permease [Rhodospirillales bacterium]|nr:ABC transporter permease [Rhodospirillales bacterium]
MRKSLRRAGLLSSLPILALLALVFVAPLLVVLGFSVMPTKTFTLLQWPTLENFGTIVGQTYYKSLLWSLGLSLATVVALLLICYPLAFAMAKVFGVFTNVITVLVVLTLFVSENIRLFGWVLVFMKGGLLSGTLKAWLGLEIGSLLYNVPVTVFGLVYVYFPFMLFPLTLGISMVPDELRHAAADLGASRWTVLREIDLPLAMPGILVGCMLTFVLCTGAMLESKLLGGQKVIVMADEIETAFTYGQNWPLGSALSVVLISLIGMIAVFVLRRIDLDQILGKT